MLAGLALSWQTICDTSPPRLASSRLLFSPKTESYVTIKTLFYMPKKMSSISSVAERLARTTDINLLTLTTDISYFVKSGVAWIFVNRTNLEYIEDFRLDDEFRGLAIPSDVSLVRFVLLRSISQSGRVRLGLGYEAVTARVAIHQILDIPDSFGDSQKVLLEEALSPVTSIPGGQIQMRGAFVPSSGLAAGHELDDISVAVLGWIEARNENATEQSELLFVEAEAGKGKTILLASSAFSMADESTKQLGIYIPLRRLPLESGIGWESIAQLIGVVGAGASLLAKAVRHGLVALFLDGIDEVSGRYDRLVIKDLIRLLANTLLGPNAVVILSGRKTEAHDLDSSRWSRLSVELPLAESEEFRRYVNYVIDQLIDEWDTAVQYLPEEFHELLGYATIDEQVKREREDIGDWIVDVFPDVGRDSSLFFVQGLAAIGIGRRAGNRAALKNGNAKYVPSVMEVCNAAAVFACLRETQKIDGIAQSEYTVERQMQILAGFSLIASATTRNGLSTPNEMAAEIFEVDPINRSEVYVAITRQNAKHALLYASEVAGNYRPHFLSDWMRCAFLMQLLSKREDMQKADASALLSIIATADRARYVFALMLPEFLLDGPGDPELLNALVTCAQAGSETASANLWQLRAAIGDEHIVGPIPNPIALSQIDQAEFVGSKIGTELSGADFFLDGAIFDTCNIEGVSLSGVSMVDVVFRDCTISNLHLSGKCGGPIMFERCTLAECIFESMTSQNAPALKFVDCIFLGDKNSIVQELPPYGERSAEPLVLFDACFSDAAPEDLLTGDWLQINIPPDGLSQRTVADVDPVVECLKQTLRTFFPSRVGPDGDIQARRYIRLSALGRGTMPAGSPGKEALQSMLESVGFKTGGRPDHLYAPWSSVLGGGEDERRVREELVEFMKSSSSQGPTVTELLRKIRRAMAGA